jgi:ubiquinone/menaquinone biosynthesis C-methylase UbiE
MKKILEIGGGRTPYFIRYRIPWQPEDYYISVDINEKNIEMSKKAFSVYIKEGKVCPTDPLFIIDDASKLNIPDQSIDEIIISNTISAPIHHSWDRDGNNLKNVDENFQRVIKQETDNEDPFYIERKKILIECLRVLKDGGKLSIYTDLIVFGVHSYERLIKELRENNKIQYLFDSDEASRVDKINIQKINSKEFCCCFRAEVLPRSEVHRFKKIINFSN